MASLYRNGKYWYVKSKGKGYPTGFTTEDSAKKQDIKRRIGLMPEGSKVKSLFFDITPGLNTKVRVEQALTEYAKNFSGLNDAGEIIDPIQQKNFRFSINSQIDRVKGKFGGKYLDELTDTDVLSWVGEMKSEGLKAESIKKYVYRLSGLFAFGRSKYRGWCQNNPVTDKDGVVQGEFSRHIDFWQYKGREVDVHADQVASLLDSSLSLASEWVLFVHLVVHLGCRRRELLTLQKKHVDFEGRRLTIESRNAKTRHKRTVYFGFSKELVAMLSDNAFGKGAESYLFSEDGKAPYTGTWVAKNFAKAGLPKSLTLRDFRHVAAMQMEDKQVAPTTIAKQLGTSTRLLQTTYLKRSERAIEEELESKLALA